MYIAQSLAITPLECHQVTPPCNGPNDLRPLMTSERTSICTIPEKTLSCD